MAKKFIISKQATEIFFHGTGSDVEWMIVMVKSLKLDTHGTVTRIPLENITGTM